MCGQTFTFYKSWPRVYCSSACAGKANIGNVKGTGAPPREVGERVPSVGTFRCAQCGKEVSMQASRAKLRKFCSHACAGIWRREHYVGERSCNWTGGSDQYRGPSWRRAVSTVRKRDGVCTECGAAPPDDGSGLDVHHIIPFANFGVARHAEANALGNLRALCRSCHQRIEPTGFMKDRPSKA